MGKKIDLIVLILFSLIAVVVALNFLIEERIGMGGIGHLQDMGLIEGSATDYRHIKSVSTIMDMLVVGGGAVYFESPTSPRIAQKRHSKAPGRYYSSQLPEITIPISESSCESFHYDTFGAGNIYSLGNSRYVIQWNDMANAPSF